MALVLFLLLVGFALYRMLSDPIFRSNKNKAPAYDGEQYRKTTPAHSVQAEIKIKTGIPDVYGYTTNKWLGQKKEDGINTHYLLSNEGVILAKTTREGFIYVDGMHKPNRLFITIDSGKRDEKGRVIKLYGAVDDNFNITIPIEYHQLKSQNDSLAMAKKDDLFGVYNDKGELIIPVEYTHIIQDSPNNRFFAFKDSVYYVIDYNGTITKELKCTAIYPGQTGGKSFIKTFTADATDGVKITADNQLISGKWGLLNRECEEIIPAQYRLLYHSPDYALVMRGDLSIDFSAKPWPGMDEYYFATSGKWGVRDFSNQIVVPIAYDWVDFTENKDLFLVNSGGTMFYLKTRNRSGFWGMQGGKWGLIDRKNEIVVPLEYDQFNQQDGKLLFQKTPGRRFDINLPYLTFKLAGSDTQNLH